MEHLSDVLAARDAGARSPPLRCKSGPPNFGRAWFVDAGDGLAYRLNSASRARARADPESVVGVFRDLPPQILVVAESLHRVQDLLVVRIGGRDLGIDLVRRLQARVHH